MNLQHLALLMREMVSKIEILDGYLFIDRFDEGRQFLLEKIAAYDDSGEAQKWINIVLIDQAITAIIGEEWCLNDVEVTEILSFFEQAWTFQIEARFPEVSFNILRIIDDEYGDVGLQLTSKQLIQVEHI